MSERKVIDIKISDIKIGQRLRKTYSDIESLAGNIETNGLLQPVLLNEKYELAAGGRRIKAFELLKKDKIPAIVAPIENMLDAELDENTERCDFTVTEKVAIADMLQEKIGERRGKDNENQDDTNCGNFPQSGIKTRDYLAKRVRLGSGKTYQHAKAAIENAIPDVVEAMDRNAISIYCAYTISKEKKNKQLSLLNESINDPSAAAEDLKAMANKRRAAKRAARRKQPAEPLKEQIYSYIRIAPEWDKKLVIDDVEALPVDDYLIDNGWVEIECPADRLADAIRIIDSWGYEFKNAYTIWNSKDKAHCPLKYMDSVSWHVVIAMKPGTGNPANLGSIQPVFDRKNPQEACIEVFESLLARKDTQRLDMSGLTPRSGWKVWKIDYATKEK